MSNKNTLIDNDELEADNSRMEEIPFIVKLTFAQEVLINVIFLVFGFLLLVFTEFDLIALTPPISDLLLLLRAIINSVLLLFIPGFALTNLLFIDPEKLDFIERIALSCGLSISLVILTGFLLSSSSSVIEAFTIYIFVAMFTLLFVLLKLLVVVIGRSEKAHPLLQELEGGLRSLNFSFFNEWFHESRQIERIHIKDGSLFRITGIKTFIQVKSHMISLCYTILISFLFIVVLLAVGELITLDSVLFYPFTFLTTIILCYVESWHFISHYFKHIGIITFLTSLFIVVLYIISLIINFLANILIPDIIHIDFIAMLLINFLIIYEIIIADIFLHIEDTDNND
ncbi:MAG: DUF1616 domain-containing protein [Candidatus Hodarchaeales archaeon]|jgi:hypothetical protein